MARFPKLSIPEILPNINSEKAISAKISTRNFLQLNLKSVSNTDLAPRFQRAITRASERISVDLKQALDQAMLSDVWQMPAGAADIYKTGALMESGIITASESGITIAYTAPYAALVHYGGYIHPYGNMSATVYLPPRPWVQSVLTGAGPVPQFDFASYYIEEIKAEFNS